MIVHLFTLFHCDKSQRKMGIAMLLLTFLSSGLWAQESPLDAYIAEGLESNLALKQKDLSIQKSQEVLREAKGLFLPNVALNASYSLAGGGRTLQFPIGDLLNPIYGTLNQLTGTEQFPTNLENVNEQFAPNNFQETKFRVVQPLFNSDLYFNYQAKKHLIGVETAARIAYKRELTKEIRTAYYQWMQSESALQIYAETEALLNEMLRVNQRLVSRDKITPDAVYRAEFEISKWKKDQAAARQQNQMAKAYFNFLLNRPLESAIKPDSQLIQITALESLEQLESAALSDRPELNQLVEARAANLQAIRLHKNQLLPELNAVLDIGYQGFGYTFNEDQQYWLAAFSLQWNLFEGMQNQARQQQARIQQDMLQLQSQQVEQQIFLQLRQAYFQLEAAQEALNAAESGMQSARQQFRLVEKKYKQDQASLLEWLDARTQYTTAQFNLSLSKYQYLAQMAELTYAAGF